LLAEFVIISFATFIGYQVFRNLLSFIPLNVKTAPLVAAAIAYGLTYLITPSFIVAIAATGGAGLINKITDIGSPEPVRFPVRIRRRTRAVRAEPGERISL
jgi:hypothetical protein